MHTLRAAPLLVIAVALVSAAALSPPARVHAGACAGPREPHVGVVPTTTDVIPAGEGVLVQIVAAAERSLGPAGASDLGEASAAMFEIGTRLEREGQRPIALRVEELGPSVARLVPARRPQAGVWRAVSPHGSVELTFGEAPAPPVGPAPELVSMRTQSSTGSGPGGSWSSTSTTAVTRAELGPPAWQGVVVYNATGPTTESPILARALNGVGSTFYVYSTPGRCGFFTPGQSYPGGGELVRIATYDLWGRLSARSNQVRVAR